VGKYCIEILTQFTPRTYVTAPNQDKLNILLSGLSKERRAKLQPSREIYSILNKVDIIIVATNRIPPEFDLNRLNPGMVIFDASYPRRIPAGARDDILVIDGVSIRPPGETRFNFDFGLPDGLCYPCMAEPMILALDKKFENYSLGKELEPAKIREILRLGAKHGFEIAGLTSQEKAISREEILQIKHNSLKKRRR
jgi:predicted amino acid dehydrogenase